MRVHNLLPFNLGPVSTPSVMAVLAGFASHRCHKKVLDETQRVGAAFWGLGTPSER